MGLKIVISSLLLISIVSFSSDYLSAAPKGEPVQPGNPRSIEFNERGAQAVKAKNFTLAEELFRQSLASDPRNLTAVYNLAGTYLAQKKEQAAITLLTDVTNKYPNDSGLFARLGDAYFSGKNISEAAKNYEKALQIDPNYPKLAGKLGTIYSMGNQLTLAEKYLSQAQKAEPTDTQILNNLSSVMLANNKIDAAIGTAKQSLQIKPSSDAYLNLGNAYEINKDNANALIAYQKALALGDNRPELANKVKQLKGNS